MRWAAILLANGVDKIFYHAGTCGEINHADLEGVFYQHGGEPQKIYAAQVVLCLGLDMVWILCLSQIRSKGRQKDRNRKDSHSGTTFSFALSYPSALIATSSIPLPVPRLREYFFSSALFQCSWTPRLASRFTGVG